MSVAGSISRITVPNGDVYMIKDISADNYLVPSDVGVGYHDNSIWLSSKSYVTSVDCSDFGGSGACYQMTTVQLQNAGGGLSCEIQDRTVSTIQVYSSSLPISVCLPSKNTDNAARNFILRIEISSQTVPGFTFLSPDESIDFDSESSEWYVLEPGLNIVQFIETK